MKYRWITQVMTRNSGVLSIHCKDRKQAEDNVEHYVTSRIKCHTVISFFSIKESPNVMVMDEIISVSVCDSELLLDIHREEAKAHARLHKDLEFSQSDEDDE